MLRALERKSRDDWVSVSRQQIAFVDDLVRRRSALSSLLNRLESELLSDGLLIMAKGKRSTDQLDEWKRIMMTLAGHLLRAGFVRHLCVIRVDEHERLGAVPVFLRPDQYDDIEFKRAPLSDAVQFRVIKDQTVVRKAHVVTGLSRETLNAKGQVDTVPAKMYGEEMKLTRAEIDLETIRNQAARRDVRIEQDYPPLPTAAQIASGVGLRPSNTVGKNQQFPATVDPEQNVDLAQAVQIQNPDILAEHMSADDADAAIAETLAAWRMPVRLIPITDKKSQIFGDELVVLKPGYHFVSTPRPVVPSLIDDENAFERAAAHFSGFPRVFWSEAEDVRGKTPTPDEEKKCRKFVRMWRDHICNKLGHIWRLLFAEDKTEQEVLEDKSTNAVTFVLPAAFHVEEIKQIVRMGVVHEDDLCELMAGSAGWEGGDYDFKTRMQNLEETTEAGQAAKAMKDQLKMQQKGAAFGKGTKRKAPEAAADPNETKEEQKEKTGPDKKKAKKDVKKDGDK